tara:strand:+ start:1103 stop:1687 length:585 start_codon:yes stop_codon:yes gene_type:complete
MSRTPQGTAPGAHNVIGTEVQAWDQQLDDIAGLAVTDSYIVVGDGANFVLEAPATARVSLGVEIGVNVEAFDAAVMKTDEVEALTAQHGFAEAALTSTSNEVAWACNAAQVVYHLTTENTTFGAPTEQVDGTYYGLIIKQAAAGGPHTIAWNAVFLFPGGTAPTPSTGANDIDHYGFRSDGTNMIYVGSTLDNS